MSENRNMLERAIALSYRWHFGQVRKHSGLPYFVHPVAVAGYLERAMRDDPFWPGWNTHLNPTLCAAYLHDVIEDCGITLSDFILEFGRAQGVEIYNLVKEVSEVSKPEMGNRKLRRSLDADHYAKSSPSGASIKLADIRHNAESIRVDDPKFWKVYQQEMLDLLPRLKHGHPTLWDDAFTACVMPPVMKLTGTSNFITPGSNS